MAKKKRKFTQHELDYIRQYEKENVKRFMLRLHKVYDADVINMVESQPNKIDYIRQLIIADMKTKGLYKPPKN